MTRRTLFRCAALVAALLLVAAPSRGAKPRSMRWSVDGVSVTGLGDSLSVSIIWTFNDWELDDLKAMVFAPSIVNGERHATLRPVSVYGRKLARQDDRVPASGDARELSIVDLNKPVTVLTQDVIPRLEWMDTVKVLLSVSEWTKRSGLVLRSSSQRGVFMRPEAPPKPTFLWNPLEPAPPLSEVGELEVGVPVAFEEGSSKFDVYYKGNGERMEAFFDMLEYVSSSKNLEVVSSEFAVTVPPSSDGKAAEKLSSARTQNLYSFLRKKGAFKAYVPERKPGGPDWRGVLEWVEDSRFSVDARLKEILTLNLGSDYIWNTVSREKPAAFEAMSRDCFPGLSRAYYRFRYKVPRLADAGSVRAVRAVLPEILSARDFWVLAFPEGRLTDGWLDVLIEGVEYHPEDLRLNYDVAMSLMDRGAYPAAAPYVRNLGTLSDEGLYAFAVWLFGMERYGEAVVALQELCNRSSSYRSVYESAKPWVDWYLCRTAWERYYPG